MKQLLLIRHAKSSWKEIGLEDRQRPLNKRGKRDAPRMADYCRKNSLIVDALISSPAVRAYSTALAFNEEFKAASLTKETDLYFGSEKDWMWLINNLDENVTLPAFFSHNPTITYFANSFSSAYIENVPTCGIVFLRSSAESWAELDYKNTTVQNLFFPKLI